MEPFDLMAKLEELAAEGRLTERGKPLRTLKAAPAGRRVPTVGTETEAQFQQRVIDLAHARGWIVAHARRVRIQRRNGQTYHETPLAVDGAGFPDLLLVRERVVFAELKVGKNGLGPLQIAWRDRLRAAGQEWHLWKPADWPEIERVVA